MSLFIAIPCYGGMIHAECMTSVVELIRSTGLVGELRLLPSDSLVPRARNLLVSQFLASSCDRLLFIDSDIVFRPDDVVNLLSHGKDCVGGLYPMKMPGPLVFCCNGFPDQPPQFEEPNLLHVRYVGTGFLCLTRTVFERIAARWPEDFYTPDENTDQASTYDWFKVGVVNGRYLSEDYYFCERWNQLGGKVFVDARVTLGHIGRVLFPLKPNPTPTPMPPPMPTPSAHVHAL